MNKFQSCIQILLLVIIIIIPYNLHAESPNNSYILLSKFLGQIKPSEDSDVGPLFDLILRNVNPILNEKDIKILKEWLDTQKSNIQIFDQALEVNHLTFPPIDVTTMELPLFSEYRNALTLKLIEAKMHLSQKDIDLAIVNILDGIKFGRMVRYCERGSIVHYMIGTALEGKGLSWLQNILCTSRLSNNMLEYISNTIQIEKIQDEAFISAIEDEFYNFSIPFIKHYSKQIKPILEQLNITDNSIFDEEESINLAIKQLQKIVRNANVPWSERSEYIIVDGYENEPEFVTKLEEFQYLIPCDEKELFDVNNIEQVSKWKELKKLAVGKKNLLGRYFIWSLPSFESYRKRSVELRTKINLTKTLVALSIFNEKYDHYPKNLSELIKSGIINKIPLDLFSNQDVNYSFQYKKIWSTGSDGKDNQGEESEDIALSCEIIIKDQDVDRCH